jgi:type IV pilus assembly protein PilW
MRQAHRPAARPAGFTLVEIMIGLLIGMIGIVVVMQTFAVSEGYKRTATTGSDAQVNGGVALYMLEREIRLAGYGMNSLTPTGCMTVRVWNDKLGTGTDMRMVPFEINPAGIPAGDPGSDVILVAYGSSDNFVTGVPADQPSASSANFKITDNRDGFRNGDLVIGVQPGAGAGGSTVCALHELTGVPGTQGNCGSVPQGQSDVVTDMTGTYKNPNNNCQQVTATYNNSSGIKDANGNTIPALSSQSGGQLFDIGALPQIKVYAIRGGNLTVCNMLTQDCTVPANYDVMVDGIVSMRAVYGKDFDGNQSPTTPAGDGKVDQWDRSILDDSNKASRVLAAAIEVTARNGLKEKPSQGTTCDTTTDPNRPDPAQKTKYWYDAFDHLAGNPAPLGPAADIDLSVTSADWQCYRYKLFQTAVPLRNMIWRP